MEAHYKQLTYNISTASSLYNATFGSIGMDHVISESCYKGQFYKRIIGK